MFGETGVAVVMALASAVGVGGAAWLLMFRPLGQRGQDDIRQRMTGGGINWGDRA